VRCSGWKKICEVGVSESKVCCSKKPWGGIKMRIWSV